MTRGFVTDIVVSGVLPWIAVFVLQRMGVPIITAFAIAMVFPLAEGVYSLVRRHRLDAIGSINLVLLIATLGVTFLSGDVHFVLLRGVLVTSAFSLLCLGSLAAPKPLMFYLGRQLSTRDDPVALAEWNDRWKSQRFRGIMRLITLVWGLAFALEVGVRVIVAYRFEPVVAFALAPVVTYGTLAVLMVWTIAFGGRMRRKYASAPDMPEAVGIAS